MRSIEATERLVTQRPPSGARALMLEAFSNRMLRHGDVDAWRRVFLGPAYGSIQFETVQVTIVAADAPLAAISAEERQELADRLGGDMQPSRQVELVLAFDDAAIALRGAVMLQRLSAGRRVRTALTSALCTVASFDAERVGQRVVFGPEVEEAEAALAQAARGTIVLSASTYALLGEGVGDQVRDGVVTTELDQQTVTRACITLAPHASAAMSTFAGLGLS